jgi:hypothetical protein
MFEKRWLCAVGEREKLIEIVLYLSRYASGTLKANICATTDLLTCLVGYISEKRKTRHI